MPDESPMPSDDPRRRAAREVYRLFYVAYLRGAKPVGADVAKCDRYEAELVAALQKAQADLAAYREARSLRCALDALMPGWFDIDASDYIPGPLPPDYGMIVAESGEDALQQLLERGVSLADAQTLLKERERL